jgi:hypothetical protein
VGDIAHALAGTEHDVVGQIDRVPAELDHPGFERHPRPQTRLLEQHRQGASHERRRRVSPRSPELGLQRRRSVEHRPDLTGRQIRDRQQISPDQRTCGARHRSIADGVVKRSTWAVMPCARLGRPGEGAGEHESERTPRCVSERAQSGNARMGVPAARR